MRKIMASLDVGSDTIKLVVGEMVKTKLNILAVSTVPSKGVKNGIVTNESALLECLKKVILKEEEILGLKLTQVVLAIPSLYVEFKVNDGRVMITHEDGVITGSDVLLVLQESVKTNIQSNMEVVNIMPTIFKIDDDLTTDNPKGMIGKELSVKTVLACAPKTHIYPIVELLAKLSISVIDISFGSLGDYYTYKGDDIENKIGVIVNLGEDTTTVSLINKGVLTNTKVLELGGKNIDSDISFIYKLNMSDAKHLKENLALAHKRLAVASDNEIVVNKLNEEVKINQYELSEIVMSRLTEILNVTKKEINHLTKKEISYIIFTGGLTELVDFSLTLEETFGKNVILGRINEIGVRNNCYSTSVGLIKHYYDKMKIRDKDYSIFSVEEQKEFSGMHRKMNVSESSLLGKLFGYFFDN